MRLRWLRSGAITAIILAVGERQLAVKIPRSRDTSPLVSPGSGR